MTSSSGYSAYQSNQNRTAEPRDIEYRLLAQVTTALLRAHETPNDTKARIEAVLWNRDVWSALRVDLSDQGNQLPRELRAALVSLSLWVERETFAVMDEKSDLDALIEVNKNIMAGLKPTSAVD